MHKGGNPSSFTLDFRKNCIFGLPIIICQM